MEDRTITLSYDELSTLRHALEVFKVHLDYCLNEKGVDLEDLVAAEGEHPYYLTLMDKVAA